MSSDFLFIVIIFAIIMFIAVTVWCFIDDLRDFFKSKKNDKNLKKEEVEK